MYFREGRFRCRLFLQAVPYVVFTVRTARSQPGGWERRSAFRAWWTSFLELKEQGAENINLVTPSHYADKIMSAIRMAKESKNTNNKHKDKPSVKD